MAFYAVLANFGPCLVFSITLVTCSINLHNFEKIQKIGLKRKPAFIFMTGRGEGVLQTFGAFIFFIFYYVMQHVLRIL